MIHDLALNLVRQAPPITLSLIFILLVMIIIGSIIIWVVGALIFFIPAAIIAGVVWFLTGNTNHTGLAFLAVAILSLLKR
jgi:hypothetical protein